MKIGFYSMYFCFFVVVQLLLQVKILYSFLLSQKFSLSTSSRMNGNNNLWEPINENIDESLLEFFPSMLQTNPEVLAKTLEISDYDEMLPNDPRFLVMNAPKEHGKAASAYARHFRWKRSLTNQERKYYFFSNFLQFFNKIFFYFNRSNLATMGNL
jgi:hypothetical protein